MTTKSRDEKLDEVERELRDPYIHDADVKPASNGMECFLNEQRVCGAACMAFNTDEVDEHGRVIDGPDRCLLLFNISALGANAAMTLAGTAMAIKQMVTEKQQTAAELQALEEDKQRGVPPAPKGHGG